MSMNYYEYMKDKKIVKLDNNEMSYEDKLLYLIKNEDVDFIEYQHTDRMIIFNPGLFNIDSNNNYYYEYEIDNRDSCDIIDNIKLEKISEDDITLSYRIGPYKFEQLDEILVSLLPYYKIKFRITFNIKPNLHEKLNISYRCLLGRKNDLNKFYYITNKLKYYGGICYKI
jgi:hypothetical protein